MVKKYEIRYALNGGFGGCENKDWEEIEANSLDDAEKEAYYLACEEYDSYDGMYGLRDTDMIKEEDGVGDEEAQEIWEQEREEWLDYEAREVKE